MVTSCQLTAVAQYIAAGNKFPVRADGRQVANTNTWLGQKLS